MSEKLKSTTASVPASRTARLLKMGSLAGRIATNVMVEGSKQLAKGQRPQSRDLLLTSANMKQVAEKLARMRGAAMKLGQLLSMDSGTLLPPELSALLARLQAEGMVMPKTQLLQTLEKNWGEEWMDKFIYFSFDPVAAASIGQVHEARTREGEHLVIKVQFPGVRESIDSDIDNVLSLLKLSGLIPKGLHIDPLVAEARSQLKAEADYLREGGWMEQFAENLSTLELADQIELPCFNAAYSTDQILAMRYVPGVPLERWIAGDPEKARLQLGRMLELFFVELLHFRLMQTDPNPANFSVDPENGKLVLYDFGAVRAFSDTFVERYHRAIQAAISEDRVALKEALFAMGFFSQAVNPANLDVILSIFILAAEPLRAKGEYDFGASDLPKRIQSLGMSISKSPDAWHTPPADVLFLHRKMGGLYLLAAKMGARVNAAEIYHSVKLNTGRPDSDV